MKKRIGLLAFTCVALAAVPSSAKDRNGDKGLLWSVQINAPGSDDYSSYHGAIEIQGWKTKGGKPSFNKYVWGGSNCPNRDLEDGQIQTLAMALDRNMKVEPSYVPGQLPNTRCLVSFKLHRGWSGDNDKDQDKDKSKGKGKGKGKGWGKGKGKGKGKH